VSPAHVEFVSTARRYVHVGRLSYGTGTEVYHRALSLERVVFESEPLESKSESGRRVTSSRRVRRVDNDHLMTVWCLIAT
jgi:hypothetical protein